MEERMWPADKKLILETDELIKIPNRRIEELRTPMAKLG